MAIPPSMEEVKNHISAMNVFQLQDIQRHVSSRLLLVGARPEPAEKSTFRVGDMVEFFSEKRGRKVRAIIERVNDKTLTCREPDKPGVKWRVSPSLCVLAGADETAPAAAPVLGARAPFASAPLPATENKATPSSSVPTAAGAGRW